MSYPCHKFVRLSGSGPQMKFSSRFICHSRARGLLLCPRPWVGTPPARAPARWRTPPERGPARRRGPPAGGPPAYGASWECRIVPGLSVPSLRSLLPPLVVRRQQGQQFLVIFRMLAGVLHQVLSSASSGSWKLEARLNSSADGVV